MQTISKAIAGLIAGAILPFFTYFGITGDMPFASALEVIVFTLISGVGTFATVYFAPKNKVD
jgi:hypothetical protein